ncbi:hypothetical protein Rumeso_02656 [Rubellimicrobium mesophilum DSM 19309]|uniref:Uncharacterized protein n=1 Tax=Rubellimicrobium mesophilum DSM 19309 TaxID=442562 RepID=A0A017HQ27_9RHOB|nr:hypothetical protein Rumeso_02656 [Rubellimicrobium mesophilum DSM 19309]
MVRLGKRAATEGNPQGHRDGVAPLLLIFVLMVGLAFAGSVGDRMAGTPQLTAPADD